MFTQDFGHWIPTVDVPAEIPFGFIYTITHKPTGKMYIGKKQIHKKIRRKPLKGKTRNRISVGESDWREYTSSSNEINKLLDDGKKDEFVFHIVRFCDCKWELAYAEAKYQFNMDVLLYPEKYFNGIINIRCPSCPTALLEKMRNQKI